jgi:2'-5' RNA ligase
MPDTWRLFIAIELPREVREGLITIQTLLKKQAPRETVRWVNPDGIHLTLKFLGDAPLTQLDMLKAKLNAAVQNSTPFTLEAGGTGCFPNARKPRVVWAGVHKAEDQLVALRDSVEAQIAPLGYPTEDRAFSPHLTLGRVRQEAPREDVERLGDLIAHTTLKEVYAWQVRSAHLIRSELKPTGAVYTTLYEALFPGAPH